MVSSSYIAIIPVRKKATHTQLPAWACRSQTSNFQLLGDCDAEATVRCSACKNVRHVQCLLGKFYHCAAKKRIQSSLKIILTMEKKGMGKAVRWPCHLLVKAVGRDRGDLTSGMIFCFGMKP